MIWTDEGLHNPWDTCFAVVRGVHVRPANAMVCSQLYCISVRALAGTLVRNVLLSHCAVLQAVLSEQLEAALQQTQASLQATEQMLHETGGLAEQQAQQNEQLREQVEQVRDGTTSRGIV